MNKDVTRTAFAASHSLRASLAIRARNALCAVTLLMPMLAVAAPVADKAELIAYGKYIVHGVGMCSDCHTPKDAHGQPVAGQDLHGASLPFTPDHPIPGWTPYAVKLAGLPAGYTQAQLTTFLRTGRTPRGTMANPPMPGYRMNEHDARAVAAYLNSIN
ncbi:c-type cytochrome [Paraburkholderia rhizosphaerae]|nr:c-type cytochrome [Paraburkholderia rhizosphaerae]